MTDAYTVLCDHHVMLKGIGGRLKAAPVGSAERQAVIDELLLELDIHQRIEDDVYYPATAAASTLIAIAHAEHRQINDQLAVALRTPTTAPNHEDEWFSFLQVLDAHADEEERDLIPPPEPVALSDDDLENLGNQMLAQMEKVRSSPVGRLRIKARAALRRAI